jgi:hypothetical protein
MECILASHIRNVEQTRMVKCGNITTHDMFILNGARHPSYDLHTESTHIKHVSIQPKIWDLWNRSLHQPSHTRDAAQHTYKTRGFI